MTLRVVRSGGQTGVDRAALDAAIQLGLPYTGWCPAGGWAEDLPDAPGLLALYPLLQPTPSRDPAQRTAWNVRDSDLTLILVDDDKALASPGTVLTRNVANDLGRRSLVASASAAFRWDEVAQQVTALGDFEVLNIAGPRESESPGIYDAALKLLLKVLPVLVASDASA